MGIIWTQMLSPMKGFIKKLCQLMSFTRSQNNVLKNITTLTSPVWISSYSGRSFQLFLVHSVHIFGNKQKPYIFFLSSSKIKSKSDARQLCLWPICAVCECPSWYPIQWCYDSIKQYDFLKHNCLGLPF